MTGSKLDLSERLELLRLARVVTAVRECTTAEFLLVGAAARDLHLHHLYGIPLQRATYDVDLAVALSDWDEFDRLKTELLSRTGFIALERSAHRLRHPILGDVDLVPFGGLEAPEGQLHWPPDGDPVLNVLGFREALATSHFVNLPEQVGVRVVSLAVMALLKILAWEDRGQRIPRKDANDLFFLMRNYELAGNSDRIYDEAREVLGDYDYEELGAWLLGRDAREDIRSCAAARPELLTTVRTIVSRECEPNARLRLVGDAEGSTPERRLQILTAFHAGLVGSAR